MLCLVLCNGFLRSLKLHPYKKGSVSKSYPYEKELEAVKVLQVTVS